MPDFSWKWFCEKLFDEFEGRDLIVVIVTVGVFVLIYLGKIPEQHITAVLTGIAGYALGRPNTGGGSNE
jgi:hypothetical protein